MTKPRATTISNTIEDDYEEKEYHADMDWCVNEVKRLKQSKGTSKNVVAEPQIIPQTKAQTIPQTVKTLFNSKHPNPKKADEHYRRGYALYEKGDLQHASKEFKRALHYNICAPDPHFFLGEIYAKQGDWVIALFEYQLAFANTRDLRELHTGDYLARGIALKENGYYTEAYDDFRVVIDDEKKQNQITENSQIADHYIREMTSQHLLDNVVSQRL